MVSANFEAALARVRRANEHRETLWLFAAEHLQDHPIVRRFDVGDNEVRVLVTAAEPFPIQFSVVFSEWLHNLRAALDATLYELAIHDTGQDPPTNAGRRQFPILTDPEKLCGPAVAGLAEQTLAWIGNMQPYNHTGGAHGSGLWWLHELARLDRHRRHHAVAWRVVGLELDADPGLLLAPVRLCAEEQAFLVDGEELELGAFRRKMNGQSTRDHVIDVRYRIEFDVPEWVQNAHPGFRWRIDDRMRLTEGFVGQSIEFFAQKLDDDAG